jgi:hypothetical protein
MAIDINYVLELLSTLQIESGGYYGTDITELSKELGVTPRGLRKQISNWKTSIKEFRNLRYLGKRPPSVTLDEFVEIEARMHSNPLEVKSHVLESRCCRCWSHHWKTKNENIVRILIYTLPLSTPLSSYTL